MAGKNECLVCSKSCRGIQIVDKRGKYHNLKACFIEVTNIDLTKYEKPVLCQECFDSQDYIFRLKQNVTRHRDDLIVAAKIGALLRNTGLCITCNRDLDGQGAENPGEKYQSDIHFLTQINLKVSNICDDCIESLEAAREFMVEARKKEQQVPQPNEARCSDSEAGSSKPNVTLDSSSGSSADVDVEN